jgi:hypothetical protein
MKEHLWVAFCTSGLAFCLQTRHHLHIFPKQLVAGGHVVNVVAAFPQASLRVNAMWCFAIVVINASRKSQPVYPTLLKLGLWFG